MRFQWNSTSDGFTGNACLWLLLLLAPFITMVHPTIAQATQLYQWKDASGVTHFTDNPAQVPAQYRHNSQRDVEPLAGINPQTGPAAIGGDPGRKVWEGKCQACHMYDSDGKEAGRVGLFSYLVDPETKFPFSVDVVMGSIKKAVKGTGEGMPAVNVSNDELKALAEFLVHQVSKP